MKGSFLKPRVYVSKNCFSILMQFHKVTMSTKYACIIGKQNWYCLFVYDCR